MQRDNCLYPDILYMWTSDLFQNAYAVVFRNLVPFIVCLIFAAEMGSVWDQLLQHTLLKLPAYIILLYSMICVVECEP